MLPPATDSSLTPLFDTTPASIICWQTRRNTNLCFGVTPVFDTTLQKRVRIDYCVTLLIPPRNLIDCVMKPSCFRQAFLLFLQRQARDFAKETYGQFVQKIVRKSKIDPAAISFPILPSDKPFFIVMKFYKQQNSPMKGRSLRFLRFVSPFYPLSRFGKLVLYFAAGIVPGRLLRMWSIPYYI